MFTGLKQKHHWRPALLRPTENGSIRYKSRDESATRRQVSSQPGPTQNILTVDLEDWYQLCGEILNGTGRRRPDKLEDQTGRLLDLLATHNCRATFFCLGKSLVKNPGLVRRIAAAGHEIASHGWNHEPIYRIGLRALRSDLQRSIAWLSDLTGREILGYRAPAFSVASRQLEGFYDVCFESGLTYDSSVFPIRGRRYGIPGAARCPHIVRRDGDRKLVELPLGTVTWGGRTWPVAGGGWWRLLPAPIIHASITRCNREGLPTMTYFHPYEFDPGRLSTVLAAGWSLRSVLWYFRQETGRASVYRKLDRMLSTHRFYAVEDYLRDQNYLETQRAGARPLRRPLVAV